MRKIGMAAVTAPMLAFHMLAPPMAGSASPLVIAQADKPAAPQGSATMAAPAAKAALSTPACSLKYLEAKVAGKLGGRKWVDFRRDECGKHETTAVFPTAISPKYEGEKDLDKARTKTCADQFTANKKTNANGGLLWVEKDGGYYAECIMHLKG